MADVVRFRPGAPSDAPAAARYHHRCWATAFAPLLEPGAVDGLDPERMVGVFRTWFAPGSDVVTVVADLGGQAIGHAVVAATS